MDSIYATNGQKGDLGPEQSFGSEHRRSRLDQPGAETSGNPKDPSNESSNLLS